MNRSIPAVIFLVSTFVVVLVACGGGEAAVPTLVPTVPGSDGQSPRTGQTASGIPPTWTPVPLPDTPTPPGPTETPTPDETYVVQAGDTLKEIADSYGIALEVLADANDIQNVDVLEVGDVLTIPR